MRTLISMTYVSSVNSIDVKDDTEEMRFIASLPDDLAEEENILAFLAGADLYLIDIDEAGLELGRSLPGRLRSHEPREEVRHLLAA